MKSQSTNLKQSCEVKVPDYVMQQEESARDGHCVS